MNPEIDIQSVLDAITDSIHIVDKDGYIVAANLAWSTRLGIPMDRIIGRYLTDVVREYYFSEQCLRKTSATWKMRDKEYEQSVAFRVIREERSVWDFFCQGCLFATGTPIFDENGKVSYVLTVIKDMTKISEIDSEDLANHGNAIETSVTNKDMLGNSPEMTHIRTLISDVAPTDATILITGETGVGKELVASEIQRQSLRNEKPFIRVNCSAIPETLMESEFFGYEKGAFTGAAKNGKPGLFEAADQGTVFLDEIGEFPLALQPKLLRAIQERTIVRVGGVAPIPIDVRILAATNQNLKELVEKKLFREDLYYRLNVIPICLPPLRTRGDDIIQLAQHFLHEYNEKYSREKYFSKTALHMLLEYKWPGNIRELRNLAERLVVVGSKQEISAAKVQRFINGSDSQVSFEDTPLTFKQATDYLHRSLIESALNKYDSTYKAAASLGMSQSTLIRRAKQLGVKTSK